MIEIRNCGPGDYSAVVEIYNHYIESSHATFDLHPFSVGQRVHWFSQFGESGPHQLLIADVDGTVAGYGCSTRLKERAAYDISVETTVYLRTDFAGIGIGTAIYVELLKRLSREGIHSVFAAIALPNDASVRLHESLGYELCGTFREVGRKFDRHIDVSWYQKILSAN